MIAIARPLLLMVIPAPLVASIYWGVFWMPVDILALAVGGTPVPDLRTLPPLKMASYLLPMTLTSLFLVLAWLYVGLAIACMASAGVRYLLGYPLVEAHEPGRTER